MIEVHKGWKKEQVIIKDQLTLEEIVNCICEVIDVKKDIMLTRLREAEYVDARHLFFFFSKMLTTATLLKIGKHLNKDHTSVIGGVKSVENYLSISDERIVNKVNKINKALQKLTREKVQN